MKVSEHEVVAELAHALCQRIGEPRYLLWFHDKTKFSWDQDRLVVGVPNRFFQEWLERTFVLDVQEVASALSGGRPMQRDVQHRSTIVSGPSAKIRGASPPC